MNLCTIGIHQYGKWSKSSHVYGGNARQLRKCKDCGIVKWRTIGFFNAMSSDTINKLLES